MRVALLDTTTVLVALYDDPRAALIGLERFAFAESVATVTVRHYRGRRLTAVGVTFGAGSDLSSSFVST